jgi:membrane peptidoglycan carboxypeptidase
MKDFGMTFPSSTFPVTSMSIGTLEIHPIELLSAYGAIADGGMLMPRVSIREVKNAAGEIIYPTEADAPVGKRVASEQAS